MKEYLVARYGDIILYRPPFKGTTAFVWLAPLILFVLGAGILIINLVRRRRRLASLPSRPLSQEEQARVQGLLAGDTGEPKA